LTGSPLSEGRRKNAADAFELKPFLFLRDIDSLDAVYNVLTIELMSLNASLLGVRGSLSTGNQRELSGS
jgi:hypothetical protein